MMTDALVSFVPLNAPLSLVASAGTNIASNILDLAGPGVGYADTNIIGTATVFGTDLGVGSDRPMVNMVVGTSLTTSNSCTLNVAFQGAIDNGSNQPGTWNTFMETGPIAVANLTAGTVFGKFDLAHAFPDLTFPRFLRLLFQVPAAENFSAGTISSAIFVMVRDDYSAANAARNYSVA
jgi:hypothetical protein